MNIFLFPSLRCLIFGHEWREGQYLNAKNGRGYWYCTKCPKRVQA